MGAIRNHDNFFSRPDTIPDYREVSAIPILLVEPPFPEKADRIDPRSRLGVPYVTGQLDFFEDPPELECEWSTSVAAGGGCYRFLMTSATRSKKYKNSGNKARRPPVSSS